MALGMRLRIVINKQCSVHRWAIPNLDGNRLPSQTFSNTFLQHTKVPTIEYGRL